MNHLIYNEEILARGVFEHGFQEGSFNWGDALLVAKYYRHIGGYGDAKVKSSLIKFVLEKDSFFNYIRNRNIISKLVRSSRVGFLRTGSILIGVNDISKVREIKNFKNQKIAIASLFLSRREVNKGYVSRKNWIDIRSMVSRKIDNSDIQSTFSALYSLELCKPMGLSHKMTFGENPGEIIFHISTDLDAIKLVDKYIDYCGGEIGFCSRCGGQYIKTHSRQFLCSNCSKVSRLEKYKRYNSKRSANENYADN
jgi:hypothetical protein